MTTDLACPLRPLWICGNQLLQVAPGLNLSISLEWLNSDIQSLSASIKEWGYNAIMIGGVEEDIAENQVLENVQWKTLQEKLQEWKGLGFKIILKYNCSQEGMPAYDELCVGMDCLDYLYWDSQIQRIWEWDSAAWREQTSCERLITEVHNLEKSLNNRFQLIYALPMLSGDEALTLVDAFDEFLQAASEGTIIAFSSLEGRPWEDHQNLHPIWDFLKSSDEISPQRLLPIFNAGGLKQGEGLWPSIPLDLMDQISKRIGKEYFAGVLALSKRLPFKGQLLEASLWMTGQMQKRSEILENLFTEWSQKRQFDAQWSTLFEIRKVVLTLSRLCHLKDKELLNPQCLEIHRLEAQELLAILNRLRIKYVQEKAENEGKLNLGDYLRYFIRDAKRLVLYTLHCANLSLPSVLDGEDLHDGFWTLMDQKPGKGIAGAIKVQRLEKPHVNLNDWVMRKIAESREENISEVC